MDVKSIYEIEERTQRFIKNNDLTETQIRTITRQTGDMLAVTFFDIDEYVKRCDEYLRKLENADSPERINDIILDAQDEMAVQIEALNKAVSTGEIKESVKELSETETVMLQKKIDETAITEDENQIFSGEFTELQACGCDRAILERVRTEFARTIEFFDGKTAHETRSKILNVMRSAASANNKDWNGMENNIREITEAAKEKDIKKTKRSFRKGK